MTIGPPQNERSIEDFNSVVEVDAVLGAIQTVFLLVPLELIRCVEFRSHESLPHLKKPIFEMLHLLSE